MRNKKKRSYFQFNPALVFSIVFFLFGCDPAESKNVPLQFDRDHFEEIVHYTLNHYIDPGDINVSRAYVGASEAALESLPYPVLLMPRTFYQNRTTIQKEERVVPGRVVEIEKDDPYVILIPDYEKWEKKNKVRDDRRTARMKNLSPAQQREEAFRIQDQLKKEKAALEQHWDTIPFSGSDFSRVISWIDQNQEKYMELPPTHRGENPFEEHPFGLNHVYFAAANGFMQSIDPHSGVLDMRTWDKIRSESEDASFEGIGARLRGGGYQDVIVETPLAHSPALDAGLRAGDIIRAVDGKSIEGLALSEVVKRIRGPKETIVTLGVERPPVMTSHDIKIKRGVITQKAVTSDYLKDKKIGVIHVTSFLYKGNETSVAIAEEYDSLLEKSNGEMEGFILDLRNNPGGYLDEAIDVAGLFLPSGSVVVQTRGRGTGLKPRKSFSDPLIPADLPVIVLINSRSASASEIVASALMDHNRALILGERSFGKASVQEVNPSRNGIIVKLTTARYYAPDGYTIQVYGVKPDLQVSDEEDGSFPTRFREEDMWKHLPELKERNPEAARKKWVQTIDAIVGKNIKAESYIQEHKRDARRPDYMLIRSLSYMDVLKMHPKP